MKKHISGILGGIALVACVSGCGTSDKDLRERQAQGPMIINPRSNPETIELNRYMQPKEPHEFLAEVKDFTAKVTDVRLRFKDAPLEIPMERVGGSTYRAELSTDQVRKLGVSGETIEYEAEVVARNERGQEVVSDDELEFEVKAPEISGG